MATLTMNSREYNRLCDARKSAEAAMFAARAACANTTDLSQVLPLWLVWQTTRAALKAATAARDAYATAHPGIAYTVSF